MNRTILLSLIFLSAGYLKAQNIQTVPPMENTTVGALAFKERISIGLEGGYTQTHLITNISSLVDSKYVSSTGYMIGIPIMYKLNKHFFIYSDPGLIHKNYEFERTGNYTGNYEAYNNTYVQLPLMGRYSVGGKRLRAFANLGLYGGYWTAGRINGSLPNILYPTISATGGVSANYVNSFNFSEQYPFNKTRDNRVEFGWVAGTGVSYQLRPRYLVFIEARITEALTDQQKKYMTQQTPRYNQTMSLSGGFLINLVK